MDIKILNVGKQYGSVHITKALDSVSFTVKNGEFIAIMGPSGSGKTSLLNIIAAIDTASEGNVFFGDFELTKASAAKLAEFRKNNLGFVFQNYNLLDTLTLEENILLALSLNKQSKKKCLNGQRSCKRALGFTDFATNIRMRFQAAKNSVVHVRGQSLITPPLFWLMSLPAP